MSSRKKLVALGTHDLSYKGHDFKIPYKNEEKGLKEISSLAMGKSK